MRAGASSGSRQIAACQSAVPLLVSEALDGCLFALRAILQLDEKCGYGNRILESTEQASGMNPSDLLPGPAEVLEAQFRPQQRPLRNAPWTAPRGGSVA